MPSTNTFPIVGAFYRPPAKALLAVLGIGTELFLMPEPENQFDPNAVAVWMNTDVLTPEMQDALPEGLEPFGFSLEQVLAEEQWHLGYIPKEMAKHVQPMLGSAPFPVTFSLSTNGAPRVRSTQAFEI